MRLAELEADLEFAKTGAMVNSPVLKEGMIPVKWNGTSWEKADSSNSENEWYDYSTSSKKWANVVTVSETNREKYKNASLGSADAIIAEEDITTMFVWIPRYSYKIKYYQDNTYTTLSADNTKTQYGEMEIKFLKGKTDKMVEGGQAVRSNTAAKEYVVHPAFTDDISLGGMGEEIEGFWMGKFEPSNSTAPRNNQGLTNESPANSLYGGGNNFSLKVTIRPNVTSWRANTITNIYQVCREMNQTGNIHGFSNDMDTMLIKNSQWGAVSYLTQSDYGNKQTEEVDSGVWSNPYNEGFTYSTNVNAYGMYSRATTLTGMSGSSRDDYSKYYSKVKSKIDNGDTIVITYIAMNADGTEGKDFTNTYYRYYTQNGQKASTTSNIYGIYDMAGGAWEYTLSYMEKGASESKDYINYLNTSVEDKYKMKYKGTGLTSSEEDRMHNWEANKSMYGDAVYEISTKTNGNYAWNENVTYFAFLSYPMLVRGGTIFSLHSFTGNINNNYSFRVVGI